MTEQQKRIVLFLVFLLCGAAVAGGTLSVLAAEVDLDEAPRQLTAPGWEELPAPKEEPVIVYELSLFELRYEMGKIIEASAEYAREEDVQGGYTIITDDALLNLVGDFPAAFTVGLRGKHAGSATAFEYKTWLVTMGDQPVSIEVAEDKIAAAREEEAEYGLRITLTPRYYGDPDSGVLTDIELEYGSPANALGNVRITDWLSAEKHRPLAVLVQNLKYTKEQARRYFALFAGAEIMSPRALAEQGPVVSIGTIKGLQELMARTRGQAGTQGEVWMGVGLMEGEVGTRGGVLLKGDKYRLDAVAEAFPGSLSYRIGGAWAVLGELGFAVHIDQREGSDPLIRCGVSDEVQWGDVEVEAVYLPIAYAPKEGRFVESAWLRCSAALALENWRFRYDLTYDSGELGHELAVMRSAGAQAGISLHCAQLPTKESVYTLGLVFLID
ncbi:MAG: hypothetical protein GX855_04675 [Firmicutes bacterium]|nr:hypothetical protein [Bacillota bacterium]